MDGPNLHASRWAPPSSRSHLHVQHHSLTTSGPTPAPIPSTNAARNFATLKPSISNTTPIPTPSRRRNLTTLQTTIATLRTTQRHLRRLHHKSQLLLYSHHLALTQPTEHTLGSRQFTSRRGEAELMFRVDFFEWYVLLERCLVGLLGSVGVEVSSAFYPKRETGGDSLATNGHVKGSRNGAYDLIGDKNVFTTAYAHRFHQNVIDALDSETGNVLHAVLGKGRVREYIGVCKEFRNRWKDVESEEGTDVNGGGIETGEDGIRREEEKRFERRLKKYQDVLRDLQLDGMLGCVLEGLEQAKLVAEGEVRRKGEGLGLGPVLTDGNVTGGMEWEKEMEVDVAREEKEVWEAEADLMDLG